MKQVSFTQCSCTLSQYVTEWWHTTLKSGYCTGIGGSWVILGTVENAETGGLL